MNFKQIKIILELFLSAVCLLMVVSVVVIAGALAQVGLVGERYRVLGDGCYEF